MRPQHGHRPPRHRSAPKPQVSSTPLGEIVRGFEAWRTAQPGKLGRVALREYWRLQDAKHGPRVDYQLWRHLHCPDSPPEKRQDIGELAVRALKEREVSLIVPAVIVVTGCLIEGRAGASEARAKHALKETLARLEPLLSADKTALLTCWLAHAALEAESPVLLNELSAFFLHIDSSWKPGRGLTLPVPQWLPVIPRVFVRWIVTALCRLPLDALWTQSAWRIMRSLRPEGALIRPAEWELLMAAASSARRTGFMPEAVRLTALALHLLPDRAPQPLRQRAKVAAWFLAESGVEAPAALRVCLDDLPFPGDGPATEKGQEAVQLFRDEADPFQMQLLGELDTDADWQKLRAAGVVLHHPLAALAWVGKRAQSYALKKQQDLLQAGARLAILHHSLGTLARIRAELPESAECVVELARALRESHRRLPVLRDWAEWQRAAECLRIAWGKLNAEAVQDEETLFFLHETLLHREATLLRCLPEDLRALILEHPLSARRPSALVQALDAEPKLMQSLEHQRAVELWSIASTLREREDMADTIWISLVLKGDAASGKHSWIMQGAAGRKMAQGRLRTAGDFQPLIEELSAAAKELCPDLRRVFLSVDAGLIEVAGPHAFQSILPDVVIKMVPSWEWAFRELRAKSA